MSESENTNLIGINADIPNTEESTEGSTYSPTQHYSHNSPANTGSPMIPNAILFNRTASVVYRKSRCPLSGKDAPLLDYKNIEVLKKYTSEKGKIIPSRIMEVSRKKQSQLMKCIKRARELALLPFSAS